MSPGAPLILTVADRKPTTSGAWVDVVNDGLPTSYVQAVENCGGCLLLLPPSRAQIQACNALLELADGLFLAGGRDIAAAAYGQAPHSENDRPVPDRDELETILVRGCFDRGIPVFGACRGMQLINVAFGGTLEQHLDDRLDMQPHRNIVGEFTSHPVSVLPDTRLSSILGTTSFDIASHHHQAVSQLGTHLRSSALSPDGLVEALETDDQRYLIGVQWHPEEKMHPQGAQLLTSFIEAARSYRATKYPAAQGLQHV